MTKKELRRQFEKYYDYIRTTDDAEQRGEYKSIFVDEIIEAAKQEAIGFAEWAFGDDINPFIFVKGKWMQSCGNSTSWTTEQLYNLYKPKQ